MKNRSLIEELGDEKISPYVRYMQTFVGKESFYSLIQYELLTTILGSLPGAAGLFLRNKFYRLLLQNIGKGTFFGKGLVLRCPGRISIGNQVMIDDYGVLDAKGINSKIDLGDQILVGRNCNFNCNNSTIRMGKFLSIGPFCLISSRSQIEIGSYVLIGAGTQIIAGGHSYDDPDKPIIFQKRVSRGILIEDNVWIGSSCVIIDGVTIGKNSIIGAGSVVTKSIPTFSIVLGNPARVIQKRK